MQFDDAPGKRQPDAGSRHALRLLRPEELAEHPWQVGLGDPHAAVADLDTQVRDDEHVALVATLVGSGVVDAELDALVEHLGRVHGIDHATWQLSTHD